jgi:hypothetical protein
VPVDIAEETAWLTRQIGGLTPCIETLDDLREYAAYVAEELRTRAMFAEEIITDIDLSRDRESVMRKIIEANRRRAAKRRGVEARRRGLEELHEKNIDRSKRQGEETRKEVERLAALAFPMPESGRAAWIAGRTGRSVRHVRRILNNISSK